MKRNTLKYIVLAAKAAIHDKPPQTQCAHHRPIPLILAVDGRLRGQDGGTGT